MRSQLKTKISEIGQRFYSNKHQKQTKINKYINKSIKDNNRLLTMDRYNKDVKMFFV